MTALALLLCLAALPHRTHAAGQAITRDTRLHEPNYDIYHTRQQVLDEVATTVDSSPALSMTTLQRSAPSTKGLSNYTTSLNIVTFQPQARDVAPDKLLKVLLGFGEHARELISSEVALHVLALLADREARDRQLAAAFDADEVARLQHLLECCVQMQIIPLENSGGRELLETTGDLCERKNGNGVDPNRNWNIDWGKKEADYTAYEEAPGAHPFSEPEAAMLRDVAAALQPDVWVAVHSGMQGIFMPYDHRPEVASGPNDTHTLSMLHELNAKACAGRCTVGSGGASVGYLAHGTATDYMYQVLGVPVAMTWEIYGDFAAAFKDCFRAFNPLDREGYDAVVAQWSNAIFRTVLLAAAHPAVAGRGLGGAVSPPGRHAAQHADVRLQGAPVRPKLSAGAAERAWKGVAAAAPSAYDPVRALLSGVGLFAGTVALWCIARRFVSNRRVRRPVSSVGELSGVDGNGDRSD